MSDDANWKRKAMVKFWLGFAVLAVVCGIAGFFAVKQDYEAAQHLERQTYAGGVNDALDSMVLLSLELQLNGERKTWGEMGDIVRNRLHVEKR